MKTIHTDSAPAPIGPYSQAIASGDTLYISGQIPIDPATGQAVSGDLAAETHQVMKNLGAVLQAAGTDFSKVIKCSIFLLDMDSFSEINEVYGSYFGNHHPARETVEVSRLPAGARVEISAIASLD